MRLLLFYDNIFVGDFRLLTFFLYTHSPHLDWIDGNDNMEHDYESGFKGGNRFATILMYMTDLDESEGGETVFAEAWPSDLAEEDRVDLPTVRCLS